MNQRIATEPFVSVCMITRNEADKLEKCLRALKQYPLELVVVDTGSTDSTLRTAARYTDKIYTFSWNQNFSDARNFSLRQASHDTVFVVDTDEYLQEIDFARLLQEVKAHPHQVGRMRRINRYVRKGETVCQKEWVNRLFDRRDFFYEGAIHEQIVRRDRKSYETYLLPASFIHDGYDGSEEKRREKAERNIGILLQELGKYSGADFKTDLSLLPDAATAPDDGEVAYLLYQLGKGYYMKGEPDKACAVFEKATTYDLDPRLEYVIDLVVSYGYVLIDAGHASAALSFENIYPEFEKSAEFVFLMGYIYMQNMMFDQAIAQFRKAAEFPDCNMDGVNSYKAFYNIGVIEECLGRKTEAIEDYRRCKAYAPAQKQLRRLTGKETG